jgi:hypothetical protein
MESKGSFKSKECNSLRFFMFWKLLTYSYWPKSNCQNIGSTTTERGCKVKRRTVNKKFSGSPVDATVARISVNIFLTGVCCIWLEIFLKLVWGRLGTATRLYYIHREPPVRLVPTTYLSVRRTWFRWRRIHSLFLLGHGWSMPRF